jgi:purine-binding chemotaxis protein CheW
MSTATTLEKPSSATDRGGKYLTFALGNEEYGLQILKVREIIGFMEITAVPRTPTHVRGVINLRGQVISVVDLRAKFDMPSRERTEQTCIIVVQTTCASRKVNIGLIVDRVSEVLNIAGDSIEDAPSFGGSDLDPQFILGMGKINNKVKILLDIDKVLAGDGTVPTSVETVK